MATDRSGTWGSTEHFASRADHISHFVPPSELTFLPPLPQKSAAKILAVIVDGELVNTGPGRAPAFTDLTDSRMALFSQY